MNGCSSTLPDLKIWIILKIFYVNCLKMSKRNVNVSSIDGRPKSCRRSVEFDDNFIGFRISIICAPIVGVRFQPHLLILVTYSSPSCKHVWTQIHCIACSRISAISVPNYVARGPVVSSWFPPSGVLRVNDG